MQVPDVNVLVYAHRTDAEEHDAYAAWLVRLATGAAPFGLSLPALEGFLRIVTNPRVYVVPTPLETALSFCEGLLAQPGCVPLRPGPAHWALFARLCRETGARGKLVPDAAHAALAIEHGCEWVTCDGDFARFPGLRWSHPLRP